jgi:hypothetical protein
MTRWRVAVVILSLAAATGGYAWAPAGEGSDSFVVTSQHAATAHLGAGRQALSFRLHEPAGVILLYRLTTPKGTSVRGSAQLPGTTVPLWIATDSSQAARSCKSSGTRIVCTQGEEWCPMPEGIWRFRIEKLAGPAGDVTLRFRVGEPPRNAQA